MTKTIDKVYDENLIEALKKLPFPIRDEKHNLNIVLLEEDVRKDQNRFEHVSKVHHKLKIRDIESIPESIKKKPILLKDSGREQTYNYYLKRKGDRKTGPSSLCTQPHSEICCFAACGWHTSREISSSLLDFSTF